MRPHSTKRYHADGDTTGRAARPPIVRSANYLGLHPRAIIACETEKKLSDCLTWRNLPARDRRAK